MLSKLHCSSRAGWSHIRVGLRRAWGFRSSALQAGVLGQPRLGVAGHARSRMCLALVVCLAFRFVTDFPSEVWGILGRSPSAIRPRSSGIVGRRRTPASDRHPPSGCLSHGPSLPLGSLASWRSSKQEKRRWRASRHAGCVALIVLIVLAPMSLHVAAVSSADLRPAPPGPRANRHVAIPTAWSVLVAPTGRLYAPSVGKATPGSIHSRGRR